MPPTSCDPVEWTTDPTCQVQRRLARVAEVDGAPQARDDAQRRADAHAEQRGVILAADSESRQDV